MVTHHNSTLQFPPRVVVLGATGFLGRTLLDDVLKPAGVETVSIGSTQINLLEAGSVEALGKVVQEGDALVFASALTPDKGKDARTAMKNVFTKPPAAEVRGARAQARGRQSGRHSW